MPHKPHKSKGNRTTFDLPPERVALKTEAIPKSASRVLNAQKIRDDYRNKRKLDGSHGPSNKRQKQERTPVQKAGKALLIQPGESLQHFNKRVEDDLRPLVKSAMQTARAIERSAAKQERDARTAVSKKDITPKHTDQTDGSNATRHRDLSPAPSPSPKEFATALPKRLNDIAQAPPEFKKLPRGALTVPSKKGDILPMSQRLLMEKERQSAIQRYRNLRASQRLAKDQDHHFSSINS